jgi:thiol-disulfide isomerase/thioredoxin
MKKDSTKVSFVIILAFFIQINAYAQWKVAGSAANQPNKRFLHIGDKIPDLYFPVSKYGEKMVRLSDFKSKLIILDLWGTYCTSCIEHMPEIEQLQKKYRDSIRIIMVTKNSDEEVRKCAIRSDNVRNNGLPFINGKENLAGFFNLSYLPQYVWLDSNLVIKYISEEANVDSKNITEFLAGNQLDINVKIPIPNTVGNEPVFSQVFPYLKQEPYIYSYLTPLDYNKYTIGSSERIGLNMEKHKSVSGNSFNFKSLYKMAYGFSDSDNPISDDRVILNFKDTANYTKATKAYIYEIKINKNVTKNRVLKHIQSECDLFFNVTSNLEKRSVICLVIKQLNNGHTCLRSEPDLNEYEKINNHLLKVSMPWGRFFSRTNGAFIQPPYTMIDETGIDPANIISLEMSLNFNNLEEVNKSLVTYGLTIYKDERLLNCIVISDLQY